MRHRDPLRARRAGWAAVLVDKDGLIVAGIYGPCAERFVSSGRAELTAIVMMLKMALPPLTVYTDNQGVLDGISNGPVWCCSSSRPAADLWRQFWARLDDIGQDGIEFKKCKGHATAADAEAGISTDFLKTGNDNADHYAGAGVDMALHEVPSEAHIAQHKEAVRWYAWLAHMAGEWPKDTQDPSAAALASAEAGSEPGRERARRPTWRSWKPHAEKPHNLAEAFGRVTCNACRRYVSCASSLACLRSLVVSHCEGPVAARAAEANFRLKARQAGHSGHNLVKSGGVTWCLICGRYAEKRTGTFADRPCDGPPTDSGGRATCLRRLKQSKHPKTMSMLPVACAL